jgi:hypothetical protein
MGGYVVGKPADRLVDLTLVDVVWRVALGMELEGGSNE